jgi:phosphate transport system substrate-binding protein
MKKIRLFLYFVCLFICSCSLNILGPKTVSDNFIIQEYQPFRENTKALRLTEPSTLKIVNNLPIIDGATALYPLYSAFVQAVYPEDEYMHYETYIMKDEERIRVMPIVGCSKTDRAYERLINGNVDIIFCAGPSDDQIQMAIEKGVQLILTPIGKEAFVFFVNRQNPVNDLSTEQIRGIYSGRIINWNEIGGRKNEIRAYQRPKNSGSQTMLESIMGDEIIIEPLKENMLGLMLDIITYTADYRNYKNAIGYSFLFYTTQMVNNNKIKLLSINGIEPTIESIQQEVYPYSSFFYAIITNTQNENVNKFIEWILSEQGQYLVRETGYVPIK